MGRLTLKQRLIFTFSIYVSSFIVFLSIIFIVFYKSTLTHQINNGLISEVNEVIKDYTQVKNEKIEFVKDAEGELLAERLQQEGYDAIFLDKNLNLIRAFGVFTFYNEDKDRENVASLVVVSKRVFEENKTYTKEVNWREHKLLSYFVPLTNQGKVFGVVIVAKNLNELNLLTQNSILALISISFLALLGSFILSLLIVRQIFNPIKNLTNLTEKIDFDKLDAFVDIQGSSNDELVKLGNKFNEMITRLKLMSEIQKQFVSNVSHELKTPLTRTISTVELELLNRKDGQLNLIKNDLFELNNTIDSMLELSRMTSKEKNGRVKLYKIVSFLEKRFASQLKEKDIFLQKEIDKKISIPIPSNYATILLSNLVSNAIKYSPTSSPIIIGGYKENGRTYFEIVDSGIGIPEKEKSRIFDHFFRGKSSKDKGGHGVGLSLVKQICDVFDIKVEVDSQEGKGTRVKLIFQNV